MSRVAALAVLLLLTAGCDMQPTVTEPVAIERVAARAQEAFAQLPPGATLRQELHQTNLPCEGGRTFVETDYDIAFPAGWPVDSAIATLAAYWEKAGYRVVLDERDSAEAPELVVQHPADGFRIGLLVAHDGAITKATLRSSSPCLG
jgi:uncharacterized lipoprotein